MTAVHSGYMATMGRSICGKRLALVASTLEDADITCQACLNIMIRNARSKAENLEAAARKERVEIRRLTGQLRSAP